MQATHALALVGRRIAVVARASPPPVCSAGHSAGLGIATEYAAHIVSVYHHYRWLAYVNDRRSKGKNPAALLRENDAWQTGHFKGASGREMDFRVR